MTMQPKSRDLQEMIHNYKVKPLVYVAGAYSGSTYEAIDTNIGLARIRARELWEAGFAVICPHLNTQHFGMDCKATYEDYLSADFSFIVMCQAVALVVGWEKSEGAKAEVKFAKELGIPVYLPDQMPEISPTITKYQEQCRMFWQVMGKMYRTHLWKNESYSPANVAGPGMIGIATRMWDKGVRLLNLSGVDVIVEKSDLSILVLLIIGVLNICRRFGLFIHTKLQYVGIKKETKYEPLEDAFIDLAVYCVIGFLNFLGVWGK